LGDAVRPALRKTLFPPQAKATVQTMVKNIVVAFGHRIDNLEWMSPATRAKAKAKLDTLYIGVGYPEHWRDYAGLKIVRDDPLGNAQRTSLFDYRASLAKLNKPVINRNGGCTADRKRSEPAVTERAEFPAAILRPPFFDMEADPAQNYGGIGAPSVTRSAIALTTRAASLTRRGAFRIGGQRRTLRTFANRQTGWQRSSMLMSHCRVCT